MTDIGTVFKKDGKYLRYVEHTTHTGTHRTAEWVEDLQRATVFSLPPPLWLRQGGQLQDAEKLKATETRTVVLMPDANRESSAEYLRHRGIPFVEKNRGAHLIVEGKECFIDFWPSTGRWNSRCGQTGFGVRNLVMFIDPPATEQGD